MKNTLMNNNVKTQIDMNATGQNIIRLRQEAGLSVKELQNMFDFTTPQAIYKWQHGETLPSIDNLLILKNILGVSSIDDILVEKPISA